jgi:hypothetical protein
VGEEERRGEAEGKKCFEMGGGGRRGLPLPARGHQPRGATGRWGCATRYT